MTCKLKLEPNPTFKLPVDIHIAGQLEKETVVFTVKSLPESALYDEERFDTLWDFCQEIIQDWDLDVPFNHENLNIFLDNYPSAASAIQKAYITELYGQNVKN